MLARREDLRKSSPGAVSVEEVAQMRAQVDRRRDAVGVAQAAHREAEGAKQEAEGALGVAKAAVVEAEAEVAQAESRLAIAVRTAEDTVVRSPLRGVVRRRLATVGQYLRAGDAIAEIVDRTRLRVRFRVTEPESARVVAEMPVGVVVPSLGDRVHPATLVHVDETASAVTRMVECLAELPSPDPTLRPGYYATVSVETKRARAIAVPEAALQPGRRGGGRSSSRTEARARGARARPAHEGRARGGGGPEGGRDDRRAGRPTSSPTDAVAGRGRARPCAPTPTPTPTPAPALPAAKRGDGGR
jgi:multidrug efflux pump subunit AcrA (membrane-fusion protein)